MQRQTTMIKPDQIERKWYVIDAKGKTLGRLASEVSQILTGKTKPIYTPHLDCGDYVIIINAKEVVLNGNNKLDQKMFYNVSGRLGGLRARSARTMIEKYPVDMIERVVWGMLPKGRLGRQIYKKLFVYAGNEHKHAAQNPQVLDIE
jgi:large subunit ribosomal protein L13